MRLKTEGYSHFGYSTFIGSFCHLNEHTTLSLELHGGEKSITPIILSKIFLMQK